MAGEREVRCGDVRQSGPAIPAAVRREREHRWRGMSCMCNVQRLFTNTA